MLETKPSNIQLSDDDPAGSDRLPSYNRAVGWRRDVLPSSSSGRSNGIVFPTAMKTMESPDRNRIRHQLQLPVSLRFAHHEMRAQSENISAQGILVSSAFLIPEGCAVDVAVEIVRCRPGTFFSGRGRVVRTQPKGNGDFAVAIKLDQAFELGAKALNPSQDSEKKWQSAPEKTGRSHSDRLHLASSWDMET